MSWWDAITRPFRNDATPPGGLNWGGIDWQEWSSGGAGLPALTERSAMTVSAIYAAVNLIAGAIAALPMHVYRVQPDGERDRLANDDIWWMLNEQMTPRWAAASGWEFLCQSLLLQGDAFAEIRRNRAGLVTGLEPVHPSRVTPLPTPDGQRLVYVIEPDPSLPASARQERRVLDQDDVLHVPGFGFDGVRGLSPLRHALRVAGSAAVATQDYSARFFANSARPDFALQTDLPIGPDKVAEIRTQLAERHSVASGQAHAPMVLTNGLKFQAITMKAEDMQLVQTRQFQIEEIARIYGVPPFMIGQTEKTSSWGSGIEAMGIGFVRYALRQHLNKFQNEINRKLFRTAARVAEFDTTELEKADTKAHFEALRIGIGRAGEPGFISVDEARARLNLKKVPGGDQLNLGTAKDAQAAEPSGV